MGAADADANGTTTHAFSPHWRRWETHRVCGCLQDLPSFLQEVTTVRGQIIYANPALRAARGAPLSLAAIDDIELSQRDLLVPLSEMAAPAAPAAPATAPAKAGAPAGSALMPLTERYPLPVLAMLRLVLARQAKLFVRDVTLVRARIAQCVIMGLLIGGLWFQRDNTLDDARCAPPPLTPRCRAARTARSPHPLSAVADTSISCSDWPPLLSLCIHPARRLCRCRTQPPIPLTAPNPLASPCIRTHAVLMPNRNHPTE